MSTTSTLLFKNSPVLCAEPLKKKKRIDPAVLKAREERRKKKLEKHIRRLEKNAKQLKPIDELEVPFTLVDEQKIRKRSLPALSVAVKEERAALIKEWGIYRYQQHAQDVQVMDNLVQAQKKALHELKAESVDLYEQAIQLDFSFLPYFAEGPKITPPIEKYDSPDGDYQDISKKWN